MLKGEDAVTLAEPPPAPSAGPADRAAMLRPTRSATRCSRRCGARRKELASEHGIPAYVIFHDSVLRDMAHRCPETLGELASIPGVGAKKLETWGGDFIAVIRDSLRG